jgi:hypothetical protein
MAGKEKTLHTKLILIQHELKAPKLQENKFGEYMYRSCEDILEAVKPLLYKQGLLLTITDSLVDIGGRVYVKATATLTDGNSTITTDAYAKEELERKKMDSSQITGATSSYARKYALNGLFLIDDTKDADATNTHEDKSITKITAKQPIQDTKVKDAEMFANFQKLKAVGETKNWDAALAYFKNSKYEKHILEMYQKAIEKQKQLINK